MSCGGGHRRSSDLVVVVAVAGSCSSSSTPSLGTSICPGCGPEKKKKKCLFSRLVVAKGYRGREWDGLGVGVGRCKLLYRMGTQQSPTV